MARSLIQPIPAPIAQPYLMPMPPIDCTSITAATLALMLFLLSGRVLWLRVRHRQPLGDGGDAGLARAVRVQANFTEYVPMALLLMLLMEWQGVPTAALQAYGLILVLARAVHALGMSQLDERLVWRAMGTCATLMLLSFGAVALMVQSLWR